MASIAQTPATEEDIDLRQYADILLRRWKLILIITALAITAAAIVSFFVLPRTYSATSGVLLVRNRADLNFDPKFKTESQAGLDPASQRSALAGLAGSSGIAAQVSAKLADRLPEDDRQVDGLLGQAKVTSQGDLIQINVTATSPDTAAAIANTWAEVFTSEVNAVYGKANQTASEIETQTTAAQRSYEEAQQEYERFLAENRMEWLTQQVKLKQQQLADNFATLNRLDRVIGDAQSLRDKLRGGSGASSSDLAALSTLKLNAFGIGSGLPSGTQDKPDAVPVQLQLSLNNPQPVATESASRQLQEVEDILAALQARRTQLEARAETPQLQQELAKLQQANEQERARGQVLVDKRDLARDTYNTMARKRAEVGVASQLTDAQVQVAMTATPPEKPSGPKRALIVGIAAVVGLILGVIAAFIVDYVKGRQTAPAS